MSSGPRSVSIAPSPPCTIQKSTTHLLRRVLATRHSVLAPQASEGHYRPPTLEPVLRRTVSRGSTAAHTISGVRWQNFAAARERNHCRHAGAHQLHSHSPRADPRDSTSRWLAKNSRIEVLGGCPRYSRTAQRFPSVSGSIHNSHTPISTTPNHVHPV